nr:hypothetical protein [Acanthopleuribacter pedis]
MRGRVLHGGEEGFFAASAYLEWGLLREIDTGSARFPGHPFDFAKIHQGGFVDAEKTGASPKASSTAKLVISGI